jgi:hypothetical protein
MDERPDLSAILGKLEALAKRMGLGAAESEILRLDVIDALADPSDAEHLSCLAIARSMDSSKIRFDRSGRPKWAI